MLDERIVKIYDESLEDQPMAHDELRVAYQNLHRALEDYIEEIHKSAFCWGYDLGRKAGTSK